jgi:hypothetical protein
MYTNSRQVILLILGLSAAMFPWLATAQQCPGNPRFCPVAMFYTYDLQITSVSPPPYVENQLITVGYRLVVDKAGVVGQLAAPRTGSVCGARLGDTCKSIGTMTPGRTITGSVTSTAVAGAASPIVIHLKSPQVCPPGVECFGTDDLADQSAFRPVAARYMISIDGLTISRTRAVHEDTVNISLTGTVDGQRSAEKDACNIEGPPVYCVIEVKQGNHNDGSFKATGVTVGNFDLIPEVDPDLKFLFSVLNMGTPYAQVVSQKIFDGISDATAAGLNAYSASSGGGGNGWDGANAFTHKINALEFGGCDGLVAADAVSMLNRTVAGNTQSTLDAKTRNTGKVTGTRPESGVFEIKSQDGCGQSGQYTVTWLVTRTSWLPPL